MEEIVKKIKEAINHIEKTTPQINNTYFTGYREAIEDVQKELDEIIKSNYSSTIK